jgi:hypothetical protein
MARPVRLPKTFLIGVGVIAALEILLLSDVLGSPRPAVETDQQILALPEPPTTYHRLARWVAINMTALAWPAYILLLDGVLVMQTGTSPIRRRSHHFALLCLASIVIWCIFDAINFYLINAWSYIGIPRRMSDRLWAYVLAFGAVVPGMLLSGQVLMNAGAFDWARSRSWRMPRAVVALVVVLGAAGIIWPLVHHDPVTNYTLWFSLMLLLDPLNMKLHRPSIFRDWQNGWYGRTLALMAGGLICGLLWEFWNYWALAKWIYHLPFLGAAENIRYFQMPVLGLLGFLPFGPQCWVMWQTMRIALQDTLEPLPDERAIG